MSLKLLFPVAGALLGLTLSAAGQTLTAEPAAVEFGDVFEGEAPRTSVTFTNKGEADFAVGQVRTTCGCTVATVTGPDGVDVPPKPLVPNQPVLTLKPGQSMKVGVEVLTSGQHGAMEKGLQVYGMDAAAAPLLVPVRARVSKAFAISPETLNLGMIGKRGVVEREVTVTAQSAGDWSIDGFEPGMEGQPLPPGLKFEVLDKEGAARKIKLTFEGPRPVSAVATKVRMKLTHERVKSVDLYLYYQVQSDVIFSSGNPNFPDNISFDQMEAGSKVKRTLKVTNSDPETPYKVTGVEVQAPKPEFFKTELKTVKEGAEYEVEVTADAAIAENFFRGNLVIRAEHPDLPTKIVPFHGWVRKAAAPAPAPAPAGTPPAAPGPK
jgi:hypothetical protein